MFFCVCLSLEGFFGALAFILGVTCVILFVFFFCLLLCSCLCVWQCLSSLLCGQVVCVSIRGDMCVREDVCYVASAVDV